MKIEKTVKLPEGEEETEEAKGVKYLRGLWWRGRLVVSGRRLNKVDDFQPRLASVEEWL